MVHHTVRSKYNFLISHTALSKIFVCKFCVKIFVCPVYVMFLVGDAKKNLLQLLSAVVQRLRIVDELNRTAFRLPIVSE